MYTLIELWTREKEGRRRSDNWIISSPFYFYNNNNRKYYYTKATTVNIAKQQIIVIKRRRVGVCLNVDSYESPVVVIVLRKELITDTGQILY